MYSEIKNAIVDMYLDGNQFNSKEYDDITSTKTLGRTLGMLLGINPSCISRKVEIENKMGPNIIICSALLEDNNPTTFFSDIIMYNGELTYVCMMNIEGIISKDPEVQYEVLSRVVKKVTTSYTMTTLQSLFMENDGLGYPVLKISFFAYPILFTELANDLLHRKKYIKNSNFIVEDEKKHRELVLKHIKRSYFGKDIKNDKIDKEFSLDENGYSDILDSIERLLKISSRDLLDNSMLASAAEEEYAGLFKILPLIKVVEYDDFHDYQHDDGYDNIYEDDEDNEDEIYD